MMAALQGIGNLSTNTTASKSFKLSQTKSNGMINDNGIRTLSAAFLFKAQRLTLLSMILSMTLAVKINC